MSLKKYRTADIIIFTLIAVIIDIVIGRYGLFGLKLFISMGTPILLFLYIRWGKYALFTNIVLVMVHFIVHYVNFYVMLAHSIGLMSLTLAIIVVKWKNLLKRYIDFQYIFLYFIFLYLIMLLVEWSFLMLLNQDVSLFSLLLNHSFNMILSIGLLYLISKQNDLMVNMNIYLQDNVEGD